MFTRSAVATALVAGCLSFSANADTPTHAGTAPLYDIAGDVSAQRIEQDITTLVNFGTRHTLSDTQSDTRGIGAARRWIKQEFEAISARCGGCLEVMFVGDTISGEERIPDATEVISVIAIQRGQYRP